MKLVVTSDTHERHEYMTVPEGDVFIHAGDGANNRAPALNEKPLRECLAWIESLPFKHKIYVPGNHDTALEHRLIYAMEFPGIHFLVHEELVIDGIKFFGSPYTPSFGTGWSYNKARHKLHDVWSTIPDDTRVLITHGPPKGILDLTKNYDGSYEQTGCSALYKRIKALNLDVHIFGHLHNEEGIYNAGQLKIPSIKTTFINASYVDLKYKYFNEPIIYNL